MALIDSLVSYWKLEEGTGTRDDAHGSNDLTGTTRGAVAGKINNGEDFENGSSDYLLNASTSGLDGNTSMSFQAWINVEAFTSTWSPIGGMFLETDSQRAWNCVINATSKLARFYISDDGGNTSNTSLDVVVATTVMTTATWYHVVGTFDGGTGNLKIYINGTLENTEPSALTGVFNSTAQFQIGHIQEFGGGAGGYFDGIIDEFGVWSRALSGAEVTELYNSGSGLAYPFASTNTGAFLSFF